MEFLDKDLPDTLKRKSYENEIEKKYKTQDVIF